MFRKVISYTDFNDEKHDEAFYFGLSKQELAEMELSAEGGLQAFFDHVVNAGSRKELADLFKSMILKTYGEKSLDGKHFVKVRDGHKLSEDFSQSAAYDALYMELISDTNAAIEFMNGVVPAELAAQMAASPEMQAKIVEMKSGATPKLN